MNIIGEILSQIGQLFNWLYVVMPWEQALRIRAGKHIRKIQPGIHLRIPFIDIVYKQGSRIRAVSLDDQTVTTKDGQTISFCGSIRYRIGDIEKMYANVHNPSDTLRQETQGIITAYFATHRSEDCTMELIRKHTSNKLDFSNFGFIDVEFFLKDFAKVKTYRFISGPMEGYYGGGVSMNETVNGPADY